jgi:hypothetical protein
MKCPNCKQEYAAVTVSNCYKCGTPLVSSIPFTDLLAAHSCETCGVFWKSDCIACTHNPALHDHWRPKESTGTANAPHQARRDSGVALNAVVGHSVSEGKP